VILAITGALLYRERVNSRGAKAVKQILGGDGGSRVVVDAAGRPRTKGSLKPIHQKLGAGRCRVSLTESGEYSDAWKRTVIAAIRAACVVSRFAGPVIVDCVFRFERLCEPDQALAWPTREQGTYAHGDVDKLTRLIFDSLTQSGLILDDSLIVGGSSFKRWALDGETAGVQVTVHNVDSVGLGWPEANESAPGAPEVGVGDSDGS
jgi:Holliday junction resolvase RusA-like endonuclease